MKITYRQGKLIFPAEDSGCSAVNTLGEVAKTPLRGEASCKTAEFFCPEIEITYPAYKDAEFYRHGWNSWSPTSWWSLNKPPYRVWDNPPRSLTAEDGYSDNPEIHQSYLLTAIKFDPKTDFILLVGALGGESGYFEIGNTLLSGKKLPDKTEKSAPAFPTKCNKNRNLTWWVGVGKELNVFRAYCTALGESLDTKATDLCKYPGPIWSSWYSWFEEINEEIIESEIRPAATSGYHVFEIDDGWQAKIGEWEPNQKFPKGLANLASKISAHNMEAGIWVSPFIAADNSTIVQEHPEYFIHDFSGNLQPAGYNWGNYYYGLDCTHPGAKTWLRKILKTIFKWGFTYFKLDFLNAAAIVGQRYRAIPREQAYQEGLKIIRETLPEAYLMASGALIGPSLGLVDGMRVSPDTAPYWDNTERKRDPSGPAVRNATLNSLSRYWLKELVALDPDVCFARSRGSLLSPEANEVTQKLARVCGVFSCSDPYTWLTPSEIAQVKDLCKEFATPPSAEQISRFHFRIENQDIDFTPWLYPSGRISDRILAK
ncbi:glycoside hydrolase family 36 protein [Varibaculum vaginae]|uniref:glycoside hydrolase family 36 protein n=1 Tax=Varibaculum vaginae TaxID=2364797 RepID=UPI000F08E792|nr:glycoside hydrolase family 36 protein [Varibaculum vaginae]